MNKYNSMFIYHCIRDIFTLACFPVTLAFKVTVNWKCITIQKNHYTFIIHHFTDTETLKYYIVTETFKVQLRSEVTVPNERSYNNNFCSYQWMDISIMSNKNHCKDIGNFLLKFIDETKILNWEDFLVQTISPIMLKNLQILAIVQPLLNIICFMRSYD